MMEFEKINKLVLTLSVLIGVSSIALYSYTFSSNARGTISVSGFATQDTPNQIADFYVTFTTEDKDKATAESTNNSKVTKFIADIKNFGIAEADIKTENLNSYQITENNIFSNVDTKQKRVGNWSFNQSISLKLRVIKKINDLTNLINKNQASNVNGPNLSVDVQNVNQDELFKKAFEDARNKAENLANASGRKLGRALSITEGGSTGGIYTTRMAIPMGAVGAEVPTGSTTLSKSLSVSFEIN